MIVVWTSVHTSDAQIAIQERLVWTEVHTTDEDMHLQGTVAIVTGAAKRLGEAIALSLADAGCDVCVHYGRSRAAAEETANEIRARGVRAVTVRADLFEPQQAAETVFTAAEELGPVGIVINSAAIFDEGTLLTTTDDDWNRHFAINLQAPFHLCRQFARRHAAGTRGHIINIADWRATRPGTGHLAYTLTKSALVTLTRILALELAPDIQVNAIAPGAILPGVDAEVAEFERLADRIPLRRTGGPGDVTDSILYLLRSDFVTGEILHVTGGEELAP
jgi:NAD(P)-dependent dehydrogenase (short-subunit alcohol dehydrogenase family)